MEPEDAADDVRGGGGKAQRRSTRSQSRTGSSGLFGMLSPLVKRVKGALQSPRQIDQQSERQQGSVQHPEETGAAGVSQAQNARDTAAVTSSADVAMLNAAAAATPLLLVQADEVVEPLSAAAFPAAAAAAVALPADITSASDTILAVVLQPAPRGNTWSPSKLHSLQFFLGSSATNEQLTNGTASLPAPAERSHVATSPLQTAAVPPLPASHTQLALSTATQRPYLGLKYLLRTGPSGVGAPTSWTQHSLAAKTAPVDGPYKAVQRLGGVSGSGTVASSRYAPYTRPKATSERQQPVALLPAATSTGQGPSGFHSQPVVGSFGEAARAAVSAAAAVPSAGAPRLITSTPGAPAAPPRWELPVGANMHSSNVAEMSTRASLANARLYGSAATGMGGAASASAGRVNDWQGQGAVLGLANGFGEPQGAGSGSQSAAAASADVSSGQDASGSAGMGGGGFLQQRGPSQWANTPLPTARGSNVATPASAHGRQVAGSKRGRDTPAGTPLADSGIKNLAEYKKRRSGPAIHTMLPMVTPRTSTGKLGTPPTLALEAPPASAGATPRLGETPATETARRMLETLNNLAKGRDVVLATPGGNSTPQPSPYWASSAHAGSTPYPFGQSAPPLDRLEADGGSDIGSELGNGVLPTPQPFSMLRNAGHTPGPRPTALMFSAAASPADTPAEPTPEGRYNGLDALPLSPIGFSPISGLDSSKRSAPSILREAPAVSPAPSHVTAAATAIPPLHPPHAAPFTAPASSAGSPSIAKAFNFSPSGISGDAAKVARILKEVQPNTAVKIPQWNFGSAAPLTLSMAAASPADQMAKKSAAGTSSPNPPDGEVAAIESQVQHAAVIPLPDDDDDDDEAAREEAAAPSATTLVSTGAAAARQQRSVTFAADTRPPAASTFSAPVAAVAQAKAAETLGAYAHMDAPTSHLPSVAQASAPSTSDASEPSTSGFKFGAPSGSPQVTWAPLQSFNLPPPVTAASAAAASSAASPAVPAAPSAASSPVPSHIFGVTTWGDAAPSASSAPAATASPAAAVTFGSPLSALPAFGSPLLPAAASGQPPSFATPTFGFGNTTSAPTPSATTGTTPATAATTAGGFTFGAGGGDVSAAVTPAASPFPSFGGFGSTASAPTAPSSAASNLSFTFGGGNGAAAGQDGGVPTPTLALGALFAPPAAASTPAPLNFSAAPTAGSPGTFDFSFGGATGGAGSSAVKASSPVFGSSLPAFDASPSTCSMGLMPTPQPQSAAAPAFSLSPVGFSFGGASSAAATTQSSSAPAVPTLAPGGFGLSFAAAPPATAAASISAPTYTFAPPASAAAPTFFGASSASSAPSFGLTGSSAAPAFGTNDSAAAPTFGSGPAPAFGGSAPFASAGFGSMSQQPAYQQQQQQHAPNFGVPQAPTVSAAAPTFGAPTFSFGAGNAQPGAFGAGQNPQQQQPQQQHAFGTANGAPDFGGASAAGNFPQAAAPHPGFASATTFGPGTANPFAAPAQPQAPGGGVAAAPDAAAHRRKVHARRAKQ